jgi:uncharacterized membrane protein YhaH (DUF805 family)
MNIAWALFSAKGRMRRRDFWLSWLCMMLVYNIVGYVIHVTTGNGTWKQDSAAFGTWPPDGLHLWFLFTMTIGQWPYFCIMAKRWHDRDKSGYLAGAVVGTLILNRIAGLIFLHWPMDGVKWIVTLIRLVFGLLWLAMIIDCGFFDGIKGANRYGASPKNKFPAEDVF